jgi:hypothetical protein
MICSFQIGQIELNEEDPWSIVLAATMFATCTTYHTTTQAMLAQLVFSNDAILNNKFDANWKLIHERKQRLSITTIKEKTMLEYLIGVALEIRCSIKWNLC